VSIGTWRRGSHHDGRRKQQAEGNAILGAAKKEKHSCRCGYRDANPGPGRKTDEEAGCVRQVRRGY
jgi:hypothetical protein